MIPLIRQFGYLRLAVVLFAALPLLALPVLGFVWLWQAGLRFYWVAALALCGLGGYGAHLLLARRERVELILKATGPNPVWPPSADDCWADVERLAEQITPGEWPLDDIERLALLGQNTMEMVARRYHPQRERPLLEMTVPHALLVMEKATRELRQDIVANIPFSHQLTIGALTQFNRWKNLARDYESWYRAGRVVLAPHTALFSELRRTLGNSIMGHGVGRLKTWLLQEYVRKVGFHAIELYSGQLTLSDELPTAKPTESSVTDRQRADQKREAMAPEAEPLRIIIAGRSNVGKSSLINAMFGRLTTATDVLPDTTQRVDAYRLQREGHDEALILDLPGCDSRQFSEKALRSVVTDADLLLWVTTANRADRQMDRQTLDLVRGWFGEMTSRRPPPILAVVTHIDMLRPPTEWSPPYDLNEPESVKAKNIAAAVLAVSHDLNLPPDQTIPVCLRHDMLYNVEDTLWAAILEQQNDAERARLLRCLEVRGSIRSLSFFLSFGHRRERQTKKDFSPADLAGEKHFAPQAQAAVSAHFFVNGLKRSSVCLVRPA